MDRATATQNLVVWAEKSALPEAKHVFSQLGAPVQAVSLESHKSVPDSRMFIFYLQGREPQSELHSALKLLKSWRKKNLDLLVFYTPHHSPNLAFEIGMQVGQQIGGSADLAFDLRGVRQLLRARNVLVHTGRLESSASQFDIAAVRKRLGLTQEQLAHSLNVTPRTLQNWERKVGTSQLLRKTRDLRELLELMDDYVVSQKEQEWLNAPLPALQNQMPIDLIAEGKLRDLIVEFQRMREGQPL
jgi:transcriptional regulator with XRE-family HTH domain